MIASKSSGPYFTPEEYLQLEQESPIKHEYRQGLVFAMAGASTAHIIIAKNLAGLLFNHLRGSGCIPYGTDAKVQIPGRRGYYYPDQVVSCDKSDQTSNDGCVRHPKLIVEVLSDSTEVFDRQGKFEDYKTLPELEEYALVDQKQMLVECFRRKGGLWMMDKYEIGSSSSERQSQHVEFISIGFTCPIEFLYEDAEQFIAGQ